VLYGPGQTHQRKLAEIEHPEELELCPKKQEKTKYCIEGSLLLNFLY